MSRVKLTLNNIRCAGCVSKIEKALREVKGVSDVSVNIATNAVSFQGKAKSPQVKDALNKIGYSIKSQASNEPTRFNAYYWKAAAAFLISVLSMQFTLPVELNEFNNQAQLKFFLIAVIVLGTMLYAGKDIYLSALQSFKSLSFNMDTLIFVGTFSAWIYSFLIIIFYKHFHVLSLHLYLDASVMILAFMNIGRALEHKGKIKAAEHTESLLNLFPQKAIRLNDDEEKVIMVNDIKKDDLIKVLPGKQIPVDGCIVSGKSHVDESMMTGEPIPNLKKMNDSLYAGTVNQEGVLIMKAIAVGNETALNQLKKAIENAQNMKPKITQIVDKVTSYFVPAIFLISIIAMIIWYFFAPVPKATFLITIGISVLVIACPCALGLATPMSVLSGISRAAKMGIFIRNGDALQVSSKISHVVFDKTGTITKGKPSINEFEIYTSKYNYNEIIELISSLENNSDHPISLAFKDENKEKLLPISNFKNHVGFGISGEINNKTYYVGSDFLLKKLQVDEEKIKIKTSHNVYLFQENHLLASFLVSDMVREESYDTIKALKKIGIKSILLTGDQLLTANKVARQVGIDEVYAEVKPQEKQDKVIEMQEKGYTIAMIGDGINDAPALAQADVSFAMGSGSDVALTSSDIIILNTNLTSIPKAIKLSKLTIRNIKQNLIGSFFYNSIGLIIATGIFYPFIHYLLSPIIASLAMALSSVTVIFNALRLRFLKI